jgi:hypothetical protein
MLEAAALEAAPLEELLVDQLIDHQVKVLFEQEWAYG